MVKKDTTNSALQRNQEPHTASGVAPASISAERQAYGDTTTANSAIASSRASVIRNATRAQRSVIETSGPKSAGGFIKWLAPLAILAVVAWAAFTFILPGTKDAATTVADAASEGVAAVTDTAKDTAATATSAVADAKDSTVEAVVDATDIPDPAAVVDQVGDLFTSSSRTLAEITDTQSATNALPALEELGTKVDTVTGLVNKLPEAARAPLGGLVAGGMESLQPLIQKVSSIPGVGDIINPLIEPMMEKLANLGG